MAGIIESVQKKKNPYTPMEAMQGPNGLTAPAPETTDNLAGPAPVPVAGTPTTGGPYQTKPLQVQGQTPLLPPEDVQPDSGMPVQPVTPGLPPVDVQQPITPTAPSAPSSPLVDTQPAPPPPTLGVIDAARTGGQNTVTAPAPVVAVPKAAATENPAPSAGEPMKAEGSSTPMAAASTSDPNSIEAQMEADRKRQEALTGAGAAATQNSGGAQTGGVMTATGGLLSDGGSGTDFTETATGATGGTAGDGSTAWSPTAGIVDQIKGIDPKTISGTSYDPTQIDPTKDATATGFNPTGYDATKAPDAVGANVGGYDANGYDAKTTDENLSGAIDRITSQDGIIMQRAKALAAQQANARGLSNSSMAVGAAQGAVLDKATEIGSGDVAAAQFNVQQQNNALAFSADARNTAAQFLAGAKNTAAMALAAEQNQNGRFNAEQANQAAQFTANAKNQADAFLAAAQNNASIFNAGEANKRSLASAEFANQAKQFAAQMEQASREFNATAYNQAQQRYVDSMNAALAAQNDAENLARRDTAQINADLLKTKMGLSTQQQIASSNNATTMGAASLASRDRQLALDQAASQFGMQLSQQDRQFLANLSASQFNQFQSGLNAGMLSEMEPEARQNWLHNYFSIWTASGSLPFDVDMSMFPPAGAPATGNPNPVGR